MNPTDEVDDLLTRAGARWRADQELAPEPDLERMLGNRRPRWFVPAVAAASVLVIAAAAIAVLPDGTATGGHQPAHAPAITALAAPAATELAAAATVPVSTQPLAQGKQSTNDEFLVKAGDTVRVSGRVIAAPQKAPVFCPPLPTPLADYTPDQESAPTCPADLAVTLTGVDLTRLTGLQTIDGVRTGSATLTGIWGDRSLNVQQQAAPIAPTPTNPPKLPCPAPAGGWQSKPTNISSAPVTAFLATHADQLYGPVFYYPNGTSRGAPVVVMVGVAHGDLTALQQAFAKVYTGNLCMPSVLMSRDDADRVSADVAKLMNRKELGIYAGGGAGMDGGRSPVQMLVYTDQVKAALTPIGLDLLQVSPAVKPVS